MNKIYPNTEVLVLDDEGVNLGKMAHRDADALAVKSNLDLIQVNKSGDILVFKIMDYGKWKYSKKKGQKKQTQRQLKEMNFKLRIDPHDQETKISHIKYLNNT